MAPALPARADWSKPVKRRCGNVALQTYGDSERLQIALPAKCGESRSSSTASKATHRGGRIAPPKLPDHVTPRTVLEKEPSDRLPPDGAQQWDIHAGIYYAPGSLKARLCVEGSADLYRYGDERNVPYERCGKCIVATREDELPRLEELHRRAPGRIRFLAWSSASRRSCRTFRLFRTTGWLPYPCLTPEPAPAHPVESTARLIAGVRWASQYECEDAASKHVEEAQRSLGRPALMRALSTALASSCGFLVQLQEQPSAACGLPSGGQS